MNRVVVTAGCLVLLSSTTAAAERIEQSKTWTETFPVTASQPTLEIENIWGGVSVRPGPAGEIVVTIRERRSAPDQELFDRSFEMLNLGTESSDAGVAYYVGNRDHTWYHRDPCHGCKVEYQFDVTVPVKTQLEVSTVNDGRIDVAGVTGSLSATNVNGPIVIAGMHNCAELNNVNGAVNLGFETSPGENCHIKTINGDITLELPESSGLDLAMDLFNGHMLTQLPVDTLAIPATVEHTETDGRHQYRIAQPAGVRIGAGGPTFTISSMNGDIRIQKSH
jgi:hypothetical protein